MNCPCCEGPLRDHDTIEAGYAHRTLPRGTLMWRVYRCETCAEEPAEGCVCEDGGIYNDRDGSLADGRGCES